MAFFIKKRGQKGFLLMEAMVALLLLAYFSIIIGSYCHQMSCGYRNTNKKLEALSLARITIDNIIRNSAFNQIPLDNKEFTLKVSTQLINSHASCLTVSVGWESNTIHLDAIVMNKDA